MLTRKIRGLALIAAQYIPFPLGLTNGKEELQSSFTSIRQDLQQSFWRSLHCFRGHKTVQMRRKHFYWLKRKAIPMHFFLKRYNEYLKRLTTLPCHLHTGQDSACLNSRKCSYMLVVLEFTADVYIFYLIVIQTMLNTSKLIKNNLLHNVTYLLKLQNRGFGIFLVKLTNKQFIFSSPNL